MALLLLSTLAHAQGLFSDAELRQRIAVSYRPGGNWSLSAKYYLLTDQRLTHFSTSTFGIEASYKLNKWLRLGAEYRFETSHTGDRNRFYLYGVASKGYKKWDLSWRSMYEDDFDHFNAAYLSEHPSEKNWRNLFTLNYSYTKKWSFYTCAELYDHFQDGTVDPYRQVYSLGAGYVFKKRHQFGLDLSWYHQPASSTNPDVARTTISYTMVLGKMSKKKKHKKDSGSDSQVVPDARD